MTPQEKNELINAIVGALAGIGIGVLITYAILRGLV